MSMNQDLMRAQLAQAGNPAAMDMPPPQQQAPQAGSPGLLPPQAGAPRPGPVGMDMMMPDSPEAFRKMFKQLSKAEQSKLLAGMVADYEGREANIGAQEDYAAALRDDSALDPMKAGGYTVARNPMEHMAKMGRNAVSDYGAMKARDARGALSGQSENTLGTLMSQILRGSGGGRFQAPNFGNIGT